MKITIKQAGDQLELTGDEFIDELINLGFRPGCNNSPERIAEIARHVPEEHRQAFWDGVHADQRRATAD